jgi:hypothetical protein
MKKSLLGNLAAVAAAFSLALVGLVGAAAPANAYTGNAWLECPDGEVIFAGPDRTPYPGVDGNGGGALNCNVAGGKGVTILKECGTLTKSQCPLVVIDDDSIPDATEEAQVSTPPAPCWGEANNCPVGGALEFAAPEYAMVGVPITMFAYTSLRPDVDSPGQFTNGTAVIAVDGVNYSGVDFVDGVAQWRFIPKTPGEKVFTASEVATSTISGANAYIETVSASVTVLPYDPDAYEAALNRKAVEAGEKYTIVDKDQAKGAVAKRLNWRVSSSSEDTCAVYETKKGAVKAKFNAEGKCTIIWEDPKTDEEGTYSFIAKK